MDITLLSQSLQDERGRSRNQWSNDPFLQRRDSSASSVRSMIDDRMRLAEEERGRSRCATTIAPPSPFRSGSPFEQEYAASRRGSTSYDSATPIFPSIIAFGDTSQSELGATKIDWKSYGKVVRGWCRACRRRARKALKSNTCWPPPCDRHGPKCSSCAANGDFCSFECEKHQCLTTGGRGASYAASFSGITDYLEHIRRSPFSHRHVHCPYCEIKIDSIVDLCMHVLADHQCAYCENEEPYANREDLMRHLSGEHLCVECMLFMPKDALASHRHVVKETEIRVSVETSQEECIAVSIEEDNHPIRSRTRTPSFSPPYMRPSVRKLSFRGVEHQEGPAGFTPDSVRDSSTSTETSIRPDCSTSTSQTNSDSPRRVSLRPRRRILTPRSRSVLHGEASLGLLDPQTGGLDAENSVFPKSSQSKAMNPALVPPELRPTASQAPESSPLHLTRRASLPVVLQDREPPPGSRKRRRSPPTEPRHTCNICSRTFTRRILRNNHLRTHTNERPFACSFEGCTETFKQKNECSRHEQTKHQEKKFVCGGILECGRRWGCGKKFARSDGLLEHHTKTKKGRRCAGERDVG